MTAEACPKCSHDVVGVRWHRGGRYGFVGCVTFVKIVDSPEHLHYTCARCLYEWMTPCADAKAPGLLPKDEGSA